MALNIDNLKKELINLGITSGDKLYVHSSLMHLGRPYGSIEQQADDLISMLDSIVGVTGTIAMPAYTYSYCRKQTFNILSTPSTVGFLTERFRHHKGTTRSSDPIFSSTYLRPPSSFSPYFETPRDWNCLGTDGSFAGLTRENFKILLLGIDITYCTYLHHIEQSAAVPYRYLKIFEGLTQSDNQQKSTKAAYYVRDLEKNIDNDFYPLEKELIQHRIMKKINFGGGTISIINTKKLYELALTLLRTNPYYLAKA